MYHIYCNYEVKSVVCLYRCHSANESENNHTFARKKSDSSISMTLRSKNPPEEFIKKEHTTGLQWSVRVSWFTTKRLELTNEVSTLKSPEGIVNMSIICAWVEVDTKWVLIKHFIAGFYQHFYFSHKFLVLKIPKSVKQDLIGDDQSIFGGCVLVNDKC